ncbi:ABC transporter permease [Reyranella sp.]|uniref:ABC transporter permease n=1 Tax=Reyranella sp. TaxID=1929291 RepID=UPI00272FFCDE|nr:ABC transporter permease [Reyranella sp.]MDP2372361.1 ABC transporter permease [Reyranella sp.]
MTFEWQRWGYAIRTHVRVVSALVRREMRAHFGESRIGYLWALVEPSLHLAAYLVFFVMVFKRTAPLGTSTALFMMTGIIPFFLYSKVASYISGSIRSNRNLLTLPPVKPIDVVVARVVLESVTYLFVGFLMFLALYAGGIAEAIPYDPLAVMEASILAIFIGLGVGMINIVIQSYFHNWMTIFGMFSFPLWIFSGVWFLPEQVPQPFREYMLYNPILHVVLMFRTGFYWNYNSFYLDVPFVVGVSALLVATGLALMQVARRKVLELT